jgi:hypothetical protein
MAQLAARAMDNERCRAKVANVGLGVQFQRGVSNASNVEEGTLAHLQFMVAMLCIDLWL